MPLDSQDIVDLREAVLEIEDTLYSHEVYYYPFNPSSVADNPYDESSQKEYLSMLTLTSKAITDPEPDTILPDGSYQKFDATFEVSAIQLEKLKIIDMGVELIKKGLMVYHGDWFEVQNFKPRNGKLYNDVATCYVFNCLKTAKRA